jgi:hypothetical protein
MDRNSIIALFLLHRRRKRRRHRLRWVHLEIKKEWKNSVPFTHDLVNSEMMQTGFLIIFECLIHRRLKVTLQSRNGKMRNCIQPVEMLAAAIC